MKIVDYLGKEWKPRFSLYNAEGVSTTFYSDSYDFNITITHLANNEKIVKQEINKYVKIYRHVA